MKSKKIIVIFCVIIIASINLIYIILNSTKVGLNNGEKIILNYKEKYNEPGVYVKRFNKLISNERYSLEIKGNVDTTTLGNYILDYKILYNNKIYKLKREIKVIDKEKPIISSKQKNIKKEYCVPIDKSLIEYSAIDNYDGDLKDKVEIIETDDEIKLKVKDSNGNIGLLDIPILTDKKPEKEIIINGYSKQYIPINTLYNEEGAYLSDGCGNDTGELINIDGTVDINTIGEYTITYSTLTGLSKTKKVIVYNPNYKETAASDSEKVIYLTFDDGPGIYTRNILDTLKKYNVKATFFVTNQFSNYINLLKDEKEEGHSIGVHTFTHKWDIYTSVDSYLNDFNAMNDIIEKYTGSKSKIFRFPGGASNTVSRNYASGVVSAIASQMTSDGYDYFDWNVDSNDAGGAVSDSVYRNVIDGINYCTKCVVLMHDIKYSTAMALDKILFTLTSEGYKFGILDENSPSVKHMINN